ncbi:MAG TPA: alpha/beta hydrolase, partial [Spirochaetota bacterium]|nr:alpha/beta hydrolase [Spirochaetota bacterium]
AAFPDGPYALFDSVTLYASGSNNYIFDHWEGFLSGSEVSKTFYITNNNMTAVAYFTAPTNVLYMDNNSDSGSVPVDTNVYYKGDKVNVASNSGGLSRSNYLFGGWTNSSGVIFEGGSDLTMGYEQAILYANWLPVYHVIYNTAGADSGSAPVDSNAYTNNQTITVRDNDNVNYMIKDGNIFSGWTNESGDSYPAGNHPAINNGDIILYPYWQSTNVHTAPVTNSNYILYSDLNYFYSNTAYINEMCRMDLYLPLSGSDFAVVLFMHGGGLANGRKDDSVHADVGTALAAAGIMVVNIDYRLSPEVEVPVYMEDVARAFHWIKEHITAYGGNPDRVFISGHSAGGYLSAIVAADDSYIGSYGYTYSDIAGAIPLSPQLYSHSTIQRDLTGSAVYYVNNEYAPVYHAAATLPPYLVMTGADDNDPYTVSAADFYTAMTNAGHPDVAVELISNRAHMAVVTYFDQADDYVKTNMIAFINSH